MTGLTQIQSRLLHFVRTRLAAGNVPPSFEEMKTHLEFKSKSSVYRVVEQLEQRGCLRRQPGRARTLWVVGDLTHVELRPEISKLLDEYATAEKIPRNVAVNEALRQFFGAMH